MDVVWDLLASFWSVLWRVLLVSAAVGAAAFGWRRLRAYLHADGKPAVGESARENGTEAASGRAEARRIEAIFDRASAAGIRIHATDAADGALDVSLQPDTPESREKMAAILHSEGFDRFRLHTWS